MVAMGFMTYFDALALSAAKAKSKPKPKGELVLPPPKRVPTVVPARFEVGAASMCERHPLSEKHCEAESPTKRPRLQPKPKTKSAPADLCEKPMPCETNVEDEEFEIIKEEFVATRVILRDPQVWIPELLLSK